MTLRYSNKFTTITNLNSKKEGNKNQQEYNLFINYLQKILEIYIKIR